MHRAPWRFLAFTVAATFWLFSAATVARAQTPPPWSITVSGQPVTLDDIVHAMQLAFAGSRMEAVPKDRSRMPAFAPYVWYAGRDPAGKPAVWTAAPPGPAQRLPETVRAEVRREQQAAAILFGLELGGGGPTWQRLYHALPDDPAARNTFAGQTIEAFRAASAWQVARATADRQWMFANVHAGLPREAVYAALGTRGLVATDESERVTKPPSGLAYVRLPGAFEPGCSFRYRITITYDADDRVKKLDLSRPIPNCL
jgi:hypothetical protein